MVHSKCVAEPPPTLCEAHNMLVTSQVGRHLHPRASHYSETAVFSIREMNPFADDLHKHLSVLCPPLIPNEFQALIALFRELPLQSQDVLSSQWRVDFVCFLFFFLLNLHFFFFFYLSFFCKVAQENSFDFVLL